MKMKIGQPLPLMDAQKRHIGNVVPDRQESGLLSGTFSAGTSFPSVASLFQAFEEAADNQALAAVDWLDREIAALGLRLELPDGQIVPVSDVQIWSDGNMSCRPASVRQVTTNGSPIIGDAIKPASERSDAT
jgi:hypothetical protein